MFILRSLHEQCHAKGKKLYVLCGPREIILTKYQVLEWAIWKKGIPEVLIRSVMSLCKGAKTRVIVDSDL